MKEYDNPFSPVPKYNKECNELLFHFPCTSTTEIKFQNYFISNNRKPTTNYKSVHFVMNGKEFTEEEIQILY